MDHSRAELTDAPRAPRVLKNWLRRIPAYLIALAGLIWVFHDIRLPTLLQHLTLRRWEWALLAVFLDILTYLSQGMRWQLLLRPVGRLSVLRATQSVYVGLFANEIFPMRFGEVVRAYLASRWLGAPLSAVMPSMIVERLLDGVWLAIAIGTVAFFVPLPGDLLEAGDVLGFIVLLGTAAFLYLILRKEKNRNQTGAVHKTNPKLLGPVSSFLAQIVAGLREIGLSSAFLLAAGLSLLMMVLQAAAFWLVMQGYGLGLPFWIGAVVYLMVHLGTALPNTPANIGTYQFFTVVGMTLFGVDKTVATAFSLVVFVILTIPLWAIGAFALVRTGMTLSQIKADLNRSGATSREEKKASSAAPE